METPKKTPRKRTRKPEHNTNIGKGLAKYWAKQAEIFKFYEEHHKTQFVQNPGEETR